MPPCIATKVKNTWGIQIGAYSDAAIGQQALTDLIGSMHDLLGTADPQVPYAGATEALGVLKGLSIEPEFHSYPGVGHTISASEVEDLKNWISASLQH